MTDIGNKIEAIKELIQIVRHDVFEDTATDILWIKGMMKVERKVLLLESLSAINSKQFTHSLSKADILDRLEGLLTLIYDGFGEACTQYPIIDFVYFLSSLKHTYRQAICGDCMWQAYQDDEEDCWKFCRGTSRKKII